MEAAIQIEQQSSAYLERVREKGQERRHFMERLQAYRDYEKQCG